MTEHESLIAFGAFQPRARVQEANISKRSLRRALLSVSASVAAFVSSGAAHAQDSVSEDEAANSEIVVTAQFREQRLQDTPIAITAVSGDMLEARSQSNLSDVASQAPSVVMRPQNAAFGPSITVAIRGMGQTDFTPAFEPGVGVYIDDVYYPRLTGANFDLLDVERVEILRGPQGTLTGRNSEGGAIRFISKRPDGEGGGYVSATYGSRNRLGLRGSADFTIAQNLFARVSGTFSDQEGYVSQIDYGCSHPGSGVAANRPAGDCTVSKFGDVGYRAVKGLVRWNPSDTIDALFSVDYSRESRNASPEVLLFADNNNPYAEAAPGIPYDSRYICGRFCNYSGNGSPAQTFAGVPYPVSATSIDNRSEYRGWGVSGNIEIRLAEDLKLTSITAFRNFDSQFSSDLDLSPANVNGGINTIGSEFWSQELRLNAKPLDWVNLTFGGYYSKEKGYYTTRQDIRFQGPPPLNWPFQFYGPDQVDVTSKAVFGTGIFDLMDALTLTAGFRYTEESKDYRYGRYTYDGLFELPGVSGTTARYKGSRWDYRASLDYRVSPELLVYGTVSTGFKGGGANPRPFNIAQARGFGPETLTAYEIGFKTDLFDRKLRFNVSAYYNDFKGAQLVLLSCPQFGGPAPCSLPQNAGNAHVKGIEAELFFRPFDGLQIDASGSLLDWTWKCVVPQVVDFTSTVTTCDSNPAIVSQLQSPPQGAAKVQWSLGAEYQIKLGNAGTLAPRVDVAHQGELQGYGSAAVAPAGSPVERFNTVNAYTIANARLTWRNADDDLSVSLEVSNLFDKYYFHGKFELVSNGGGFITGTPARPREWALTVKKSF